MGSLLSLGHTRGSNGNKQPCTSIYNICLTFKYFCLILNSGRCNLFRIGQGIIKCPHCRYSMGQKIPERVVEKAIDDMIYRINMSKQI